MLEEESAKIELKLLETDTRRTEAEEMQIRAEIERT